PNLFQQHRDASQTPSTRLVAGNMAFQTLITTLVVYLTTRLVTDAKKAFVRALDRWIRSQRRSIPSPPSAPASPALRKLDLAAFSAASPSALPGSTLWYWDLPAPLSSLGAATPLSGTSTWHDAPVASIPSPGNRPASPLTRHAPADMTELLRPCSARQGSCDLVVIRETPPAAVFARHNIGAILPFLAVLAAVLALFFLVRSSLHNAGLRGKIVVLEATKRSLAAQVQSGKAERRRLRADRDLLQQRLDLDDDQRVAAGITLPLSAPPSEPDVESAAEPGIEEDAQPHKKTHRGGKNQRKRRQNQALGGGLPTASASEAAVTAPATPQ
ncbi:hypothetical protein LTR53_010955, partial [Teratosphaeriaceae sp. CCFEE 6253]